MSKTSVISAKVEPFVADALKLMAKNQGKSVSALISDMATRVEPDKIVSSTNVVPVSEDFTNNLAQITAALGGSSLVGILCYKGIKAVLDSASENNKIQYTDGEIEFISATLGVCGAILTGIGIHKALNK